MAKFKYAQRSYEDTQTRANQRGGSFDSWIKEGVKTFKAKEGLNTVRFLPMPEEHAERLKVKHYGYDVWVHYDIGGDKNSYPCLEQMKGEFCPVCEYKRELEAEKADKEEIKKLNARKSVVCYIIDRDKESEGPLVWPMSFTIDKEFSQLSMDTTDKTFLAIEDPDEGYDISFIRNGTGLMTKYESKQIARKKSYLCRNEADQDRALEFVTDHPLDEIVQYYSREDIEKAMRGMDRDSADEPPRRGRDRDEGDRGEERQDRRRENVEMRRPAEPAETTERRGAREDTRGEGRGGTRRLRDEVDDRERRAGRDAEPEDDPPRRRGREEDPDPPTREERDVSRRDEPSSYEDDDGNLIDSETGDIIETAAERGRGRATKEPAEDRPTRRRPAGRDERPEPAEDRPRASGKVSDDPPARSSRGRAAEPEDPPTRRRPPADEPPPRRGADTGEARGRLADMRDRRAGR